MNVGIKESTILEDGDGDDKRFGLCVDILSSTANDGCVVNVVPVVTFIDKSEGDKVSCFICGMVGSLFKFVDGDDIHFVVGVFIGGMVGKLGKISVGSVVGILDKCNVGETEGEEVG